MGRRDMTTEEGHALYEAVLVFARRAARSEELAHEITQQAFLRLLTTSPRDPKRHPSIEHHMFGIVRSRLSLARRERRRDYEEEAGREQLELADSETWSPQERSLQWTERERKEAVAARQSEALRARLAGHELELSICDLMSKGVARRSDLVARTGRPDPEVAAALQRIRRYARTIVAADGGTDEEVMS